MRRLAQTTAAHRWSCLAYCLLDNHFHLVVETPQPNLGLGMKWLKGAHARDFNHRHGRSGHLFGGRFYSAVIERESHLMSAIVYVALNPVRAGLVERAESWPWSSYAAVIGLTSCPPFLDSGRVLELVDERPDVAGARLAELVRSETLRVRQEVRNGLEHQTT